MRISRSKFVLCTSAIVAAAATSLGAVWQGPVRDTAPQDGSVETDTAPGGPDAPSLRVDLGERVAFHPAVGSFRMDAHEIWKPVCSSDTASIGPEELEKYVAQHELLSSGIVPRIVVDNPSAPGPGGLNLVYVVSGSVPPGALAGVATAEAYLEGIFTADPMTVTIPMTFQPMNPGVLGGTSSASGYLTYTDSRSVIVGGMDASDTIQSFLPTGSTCPIRYSSGSAVTNENRVFFTFANFKANGGSVAGNDANMTFNSSFTWDFDPSNGVSGSNFSFVDVLIHETGHALGFTSGGDFRVRDCDVLDLYRFQRTDGAGDYNPDTTAEFQVRARRVAFNAPNDDHNSDVVSVEYRMSDGSPYQMSHFREQATNIGLMDPAFAPGETWYPAYFSTADTTMFDAIGYNL